MSWKKEVEDGDRFEFGENWSIFLNGLNDERIEESKSQLIKWLGNIENKTFLYIGNGSGIHSLAAKMLGAKVYSFEYDLQGVECAKILKERYFPDDNNWNIEKGRALDKEYIQSLGKFDIVYSWRVLHHTGEMYKAFEYTEMAVNKRGYLFISIYNNQGYASEIWSKYKNIYLSNGFIIKNILLYSLLIYSELRGSVKRLLTKKNPFSFKHWDKYYKHRGMSRMHDYLDWVGGYPFEVAKPEEIFDFYKKKGYTIEKQKTCAGGKGCNEFLFKNI